MKQQIQALEHASPRARVALFMEMRLGKTLVAIRWTESNRGFPALVVAPKSVIPPWKNELLEEEYAYEDITTIDNKSLFFNDICPWWVTNYERVLASPEILECPWKTIILDESTRIRNPKAQITKLLNKKAYRIGNRMILSGYPCPESPMDYFEQMNFLFGNFMHENGFWYWRRKYFMQIGYDWIPRSGTIGTIKRELDDLSFTLTRKEAGIGSKKIYEKRYVELNETQKIIYKQVQDQFEYEYKKENNSTKYIVVKIQWMQRICGGFTPDKKFVSDSKVKEIHSLLRTELKNEKVVVWFKYNRELKYVRDYFSTRGFKVGEFTAECKDGVDEKGKIRDDVQILVVQPKCGMYGQDWSKSSTSIYYSNWFDGEIRQQSLDRIIHPKKKEPVLIIDLVTRGTIDEDILEVLGDKKINYKLFMTRLMERLRSEKRTISVKC